MTSIWLGWYLCTYCPRSEFVRIHPSAPVLVSEADAQGDNDTSSSRQSFGDFFRRVRSSHDGSMGLVYTPIFTIKINHSCDKYTSPMGSYGGLIFGGDTLKGYERHFRRLLWRRCILFSRAFSLSFITTSRSLSTWGEIWRFLGVFRCVFSGMI